MQVKRLVKTSEFPMDYSVHFIKENGLFVNFIRKFWSHDSSVRAAMKYRRTFIDDVDKMYKPKFESCREKYHKITIDDKTYYYSETTKGNGWLCTIYKELPLLIDDGNFIWKNNSRYNSKEATITFGAFEYLCIVNSDGNGKVIVRYAKRENYHRNRVTLAEINVPEAYNEKFLDVINNWNKELKESLVVA